MRIALVALFAVGLMSCGGSGGGDDKPQVDEQKPTVSIVKPGSSVQALDPLEIEASLSDNVELKSYHITLKPVADGTKGNPAFEWDSFTDKNSDGGALPTIPAGSKTYSVKFSMDISDAAAGSYLLTVEATDKSQNVSTPATKTISVAR